MRNRPHLGRRRVWLWFPPVAALIGPAASIGNTVVKRLFGEGDKRADGSGGVELLAEAQRALAS